ncbi:SHOCT domain-containing protein [Streptomyces sp. LP11]|uniref:SHOCT domain-containing protein n=1 Tax=Streptomyces pyxinicus TaxID=2970331 RepID=A0ABT2AU62_9ACTN|nr:SHOCT domain-containing protein [Streptomyces sp. LP11]MCS0599671.1 SHOCT domain-containing protein [Streptomyces sp. LP11]
MDSVEQQQQAYGQPHRTAPPPAPADPPPGTDAPDELTRKIDQLKQLTDLKTQGVLSDAEFEQRKRQLLA